MLDSIRLSFGLLLVPLILQLIMYFLAKPYKTFQNPQWNSNRISTTVLTSFFLCQAFALIWAFDSDDYFSYLIGFDQISTEIMTLGFEPVYNWLAKLTGDYLFWRGIIWGTAILFMFFVAKRLDLTNRNLLLAIALWGFVLDYYSRGVLGHTMLLLGVVLLVDRNSNVYSKYIGIVLLVSSYFFHKSMPVNIAFALLAFFPLFNKKNVIIFSLIAFPFLTTTATWLIDSIVSGAMDISFAETTEGAGDRMMFYATGEKHYVSTMGYLGQIIQLTPEYLTMWYLVDRVVFKNYLEGIKRERIYLYLFRFSYVTIYIASLFAFVETSSWIYMRFKYMAFFPMVFILAKVWSLEPRTNKWIKAIIILQMFSFFWKWLFRIYRYLETTI